MSRKTLAPGIVFTHWQARVSGVSDTQDVFQVSWTMGDSHIGLHAALMGTRHSDGSIDIRPISQWASIVRPRGLAAMVNGDFFSWSSSSTATPSGMLVHNGRLLQEGWGGSGGAPSVGFGPAGALVFGRPVAPPLRFMLPGGHTATVAGFSVMPAKPDQVGVYTKPGASVSIAAGMTAVVAGTNFKHVLRGSSSFSNISGSGVKESVAGFVLTPMGTPAPLATVPIHAPAAGSTAVTVPFGGSVLMMKSGGLAATGFASLLAQATPSVKVTTSDAAWAGVRDVISGKPQVVTNGVPLVTKPSYVTDDQWYPEQLRPAIASSANGHGWFVLIGSVNGINGTSLTGAQFSRVLTQLGAKDALQLDNRHSSEIFMPSMNNGECVAGFGWCHTLMPHYERYIPEAAYLTYH
jgi:Phosphodiester glycosidase